MGSTPRGAVAAMLGLDVHGPGRWMRELREAHTPEARTLRHGRGAVRVTRGPTEA